MTDLAAPPPLTADVTVTAVDRAAAVAALLEAGRQALAERFGRAAPAVGAALPAHLLHVARVLEDDPGVTGHTLRALVAVPFGVLERAALQRDPDGAARSVLVRCGGGELAGPGVVEAALNRALGVVGFPVGAALNARTVTGRAEVSVRGVLRDGSGVAAAKVCLHLDGATVCRDATGSGPTPAVAARAALTHAANRCAHPLVMALLAPR